MERKTGRDRKTFYVRPNVTLPSISVALNLEEKYLKKINNFVRTLADVQYSHRGHWGIDPRSR